MRIRLLFCIVIVIMSVLAGCQGLTFRATSTPADIDGLLTCLAQQEGVHVSFLVERGNEKALRAWVFGAEVVPEQIEAKWREARDSMEGFQQCRVTTGLGTMVMAEISTPGQAIATVCHNWTYQVQCEELHLKKEHGQWQVVASEMLQWVYCDPPEAP